MRRLTAAFATKRERSPEPTIAKKRSGFFSKPLKPSASAEAEIPPVPALTRPSVATPVSSASSDASSSIRTPEDEPSDSLQPSGAKKWHSWVTGKRKAPLPASPVPVSHRTSFLVKQRFMHESDDDDDSDGYSSSASSTPVAVTRVLDPTAIPRSQHNLHALTQQTLDTLPSSHPLLNSLAVVFPKSSNSSSSLPRTNTTLMTMQKTRILRRLEAKSLSPYEEASILYFSQRPKTAAPAPRTRRIDDEAVSDSKKVGVHSRGLRRWMRRVTFEERAVVWVSVNDGFACRRVSGKGIAIAELEFSDGLLALAGLDDRTPDESTVAPGPSFDVARLVAKLPSPRPPVSRTTLPTPAFRSLEPQAASTRSKTLPPLRGTEDHDDDIPLAVVIKAKKEQATKEKAAQHLRRQQREEKERLLQEQQRKRVLVEEHRAKEEERQRRHYTNEVLSARLRREQNRSSTYLQDLGGGRDVDRRASILPPKSGLKNDSSAPLSAPARTEAFHASKSAPSSPKRRPVSLSSNPAQRADKSSIHPCKPLTSRSTSTLASTLHDDHRPSKSDGRVSSHSQGQSEGTSRAGRESATDARRTLPRSFKPDSFLLPPPPLPRVASQPQFYPNHLHFMSATPIPPVPMLAHAPSSWHIESPSANGSIRSRSNSHRPSVVDYRMSGGVNAASSAHGGIPSSSSRIRPIIT